MDESLDLGALGFAFAVEAIKPEYGHIVAHQVDWQISEGKGSRKVTAIQMEPCETLGPHDIPLTTSFSDLRDMGEEASRQHLCPVAGAAMIAKGSYYDPEYSYISLSVLGCDASKLEAGTTCLDSAKLTAYAQSLKLFLPDSSVDFESETFQSVTWALDSSTVLSLDPTSHNRQEIFMSKSHVYIESKWHFTEITEDQMNFVEHKMGSTWSEPIPAGTALSERTYASVQLKAGSKLHRYSVEPYKILDLLGDMGGFLEIIMTCGLLLTFFFV